jgi:hypothetical protein
MWECVNCKEQIEDRYKHCWNCGGPKTEKPPVAPTPNILRVKNEPPTAEVSSSENVPPRRSEEAPPAELRSEPVAPSREKVPVREERPKEEIPPAEIVRRYETVPFEDTYSDDENSPSVIGKIVPAALWLAALALVAGFAYYSSQKTRDFESRIAEDARALGAQTNQFAFVQTAREKKGTVEKKASVQAKVLPLNAQTKEIDGLYGSLPDDLRPATLEEVKTILWLDCKPSEAGRYDDGSPAFQDKCNGYLVDRNTSKVIQVQDFMGELPPLKKTWGGSYASGRVLPETYISYIKANQPENERSAERFASDSPNHHLWFKSELLYAGILLVLLAAVGIGWIIYRIKSAWRPE